MADQIPLGNSEHTLCLNQLRALAGNDNSPSLTSWERSWMRNQLARLEEWGDGTFISYPEAAILGQLVKKLGVFIPPTPANSN